MFYIVVYDICHGCAASDTRNFYFSHESELPVYQTRVWTWVTWVGWIASLVIRQPNVNNPIDYIYSTFLLQLVIIEKSVAEIRPFPCLKEVAIYPTNWNMRVNLDRKNVSGDLKL